MGRRSIWRGVGQTAEVQGGWGWGVGDRTNSTIVRSFRESLQFTDIDLTTTTIGAVLLFRSRGTRATKYRPDRSHTYFLTSTEVDANYPQG